MAPGGGGGGGYYDDWNPYYGWYDSAGGIDLAGGNYNADGPSTQSMSQPTLYMPGSFAREDGPGVVNVYFAGKTSDGLNGDQMITPELAITSISILGNTPGLNFVNVFATTNGVHDTHSDHYSGNAIDINAINGVRVAEDPTKAAALQLEAQALADPNTRYVEGPGGNWVRDSPGGQWRESRPLPGMDNHVHWSIFRR